MDKKKSLWKEFSKGIVKENPVLRLVLGCCATLAVSTSASNAIGMGLATTFVLVCSNAVISILRKIIPDKVRIPHLSQSLQALCPLYRCLFRPILQHLMRLWEYICL